MSVLNLPEVREEIINTGSEPGGDSPEAFAAFIRAEHARWGQLIREAGIRLVTNKKPAGTFAAWVSLAAHRR